MFHYVYEIGKKALRDSEDLTSHTQAITEGIKATYGDKIEVMVSSDQFEFHLHEEASNVKLRQMGKKIIACSKELASLVKTYLYTNNQDGSPGTSTQLFVKKK